MVEPEGPNRSWPKDADTALDQLMDVFGSWLLRLAVLKLGDRTLAEDALQETFLRAYRAWPGFRERGRDAAVRSWLARMAVQVCADLGKRQALLRAADVPQWEASPQAGFSSNPEDLAVVREERRDLQKVLTEMSEEDRRILLLRYYFDLSPAQIARLERCPQVTVRSRLFRARKRLRQSWRGGVDDESRP